LAIVHCPLKMMDHDFSSDSDLEDAIVEDLLPKLRRARQVEISFFLIK
jgi:hypothetical protein